jgi:hypothetical protein
MVEKGDQGRLQERATGLLSLSREITVRRYYTQCPPTTAPANLNGLEMTDAATSKTNEPASGDTSAEGLNGLAKKASEQSPRYVNYTFETPFNRAFYGSTKHPYQ